MLSKFLFGLLAAKAAIASPIAEAEQYDIDFTPDTLKEAQELNKFLQDLNSQRIHLNETEWKDLFTKNGILLEPPPIDYDFLNFTAEVDVDVDVNTDLQKRQRCRNIQSRVITKTDTFVDWDIQMSNVVCGIHSTIDIFVANGISITNTLTFDGGLDGTVIKDWLRASFGVSYSISWTSSATNQNKATVQIGNCGAMVLRPTVTRRYGEVYQGCVDDKKKIGTFMSDDRFGSSYNGVNWVDGTIADCQRRANNAPIPRCQGAGLLK